MVIVCCSRYHKGVPIIGTKPPYEDLSDTHTLCNACLSEEMDKLEREGKIHRGWRERFVQFKNSL